MQRKTLRTLTTLAVALTAAAALTAGIAAKADHYQGIAIAGFSDGHDYFLIDGIGSSYNDSSTPDPAQLYGYSSTYTGSGGDINFTAAAAIAFRGNWSTGSYSYGNVQNAYYPTDAPYSNTPPFGYYVEGGAGSWTKNTFISPTVLTDPTADFHWSISGNTNGTTFGTANARLDFGVSDTGLVSNLYDMWDPTKSPGTVTEYGTGQYTYHTAIALNTPLDFLFWSSSYWQVTPAQLATLGTAHEDLTGYAQFFDTIELDSIDLHNGDGSLVTDWSLLNSQGQVVFNQAGPVTAAVPEPGTWAFLGTGIVAFAGLLRRRRSSSR